VFSPVMDLQSIQLDSFPHIYDNMGILDELYDDNTWNTYLNRKLSSVNVGRQESDRLREYVSSKRYLPVVDRIVSGHEFPIPVRKVISKGGTSKKRIVYSFPEDEMTVLKVMAELLHRYDRLFSDNLYSFRRESGVRVAIRKLYSLDGLDRMYAYKVDISNYFNSIRWENIRDDLSNDLDDPGFLGFLDSLFGDDRAISDGEVIRDDGKGAMAGVPLSAFLANYYLGGLDRRFTDPGVLYMRYSDDILVVAEDEQSVIDGRREILEHIRRKGLSVNPDKERFMVPGEPIEFLGFRFENGVVDISSVTLSKMKDRIRRSARSIRRWMLRKGVEPEKALRVMIRKFDRKFFGNGGGGIDWSLWYFPVIDTDGSLRAIDLHLQQWCRFVITGRHSGKNHDAVPYDMLRRNGYRTLVCEYHRFRDNRT